MPRKRLTKTFLMQLIEARHPGQTVEALMLAAFARYGNEREAAQSLGITQQALNAWKYRLKLEDVMAQARAATVEDDKA